MKLLRTTLVLLATIFSSTCLVAQNSMKAMLKERGEIVVSIDAENLKQIPHIYSYSVDGIKDGKAFMYLNKKQFQILNKLGISMKQEAIPSIKEGVKMANSVSEMKDWNSYPDYDTYLAMMEQFTIDYPTLCKLDTIGYSEENRLLIALKISDNVNTDELEPEFFYTSSMHGDELAGYVLMLRYADYLLSNYNNARIKNMVDNIEIYINPLANPDGTFAGGNSSVNGATRFNANYVDINRNFKDPKRGDHPDGESWQAETVAMMEYAHERNFAMSMNFHGGIELLNYPWDTYYQRHADNDWFIHICQEYVDTVHAIDANYMIDMNNGITNGYDWYEVAGGRQDYYTYFAHGREVTAELSTVKLVNASQLPGLWDKNYRSLLNYMEQVLYGVYGTVKNTSGEVLNAKVFIPGHDDDSTHVWAQNSGTYYRMLAEGTYQISYEAEGYETQTVQVDIDYNERVQMNVVLEPFVDRPTVELFTEATNPTNASPIVIYAEFSDEVSGFELADIVVTNGVAENFQQETTNKVWSADITPQSEGAVTVNIPENVALDIENSGNYASNTLNFYYDITAPVVSAFYVNYITTTTAKITVSSNEECVFYVVGLLASDDEPTITDIKNGTGANGTTVIYSNNGSLSDGNGNEMLIDNLTYNTDYKLYLISEDVAGNISDILTIEFKTLNTDISLEKRKQLNVFPNPTHKDFYVEVPQGETFKLIRIYSTTGKIEKTINQLFNNANYQKLDISGLHTGIYFMLLETVQNSYKTKFVIE